MRLLFCVLLVLFISLTPPKAKAYTEQQWMAAGLIASAASLILFHKAQDLFDPEDEEKVTDLEHVINKIESWGIEAEQQAVSWIKWGQELLKLPRDIFLGFCSTVAELWKKHPCLVAGEDEEDDVAQISVMLEWAFAYLMSAKL